jgi:hypothetical protein
MKFLLKFFCIMVFMIVTGAARADAFQGVEWNASFDRVKQQYPHASILDSSKESFCAGQTVDICRTFQVILNEHWVGNMLFKAIFGFSTDAKLDTVTLYLEEPHKYSINSLELMFNELSQLLQQKYSAPFGSTPFSAVKNKKGLWDGRAERVWFTKDTVIKATVYIQSTERLDTPSYDKSSAYMYVTYKPLKKMLSGL